MEVYYLTAPGLETKDLLEPIQRIVAHQSFLSAKHQLLQNLGLYSVWVL